MQTRDRLATAQPDGQTGHGARARDRRHLGKSVPRSGLRKRFRIAQFLVPINKFAIAQRLLLKVGHSGQAGGLTVRYTLLPNLLSLVAIHPDAS